MQDRAEEEARLKYLVRMCLSVSLSILLVKIYIAMQLYIVLTKDATSFSRFVVVIHSLSSAVSNSFVKLQHPFYALILLHLLSSVKKKKNSQNYNPLRRVICTIWSYG